jgi:hypothetical protein
MAIEFTANIGGYAVTTRSDSHYFTVYRGGQIMGTITRPMRHDRHWSAYTTEGHFLGSTIGPRTALGLFVRRDRLNQLMPDDRSGFIDGKGIVE